MPDAAYALADLCDLADVTPRTVRYYVTEGLLRSPGTTGPRARYDAGHLARLRLIRRLQREHLPLAEIRRRLAALTDAEAIDLASGSTEPPRETALEYVRTILGTKGVPSARRATVGAPTPSVPRSLERRVLAAALLESPATGRVPPSGGQSGPLPQRSQWERIVLAPEVELHVRRPLTRSQNRAVARLLDEARRLLEEDQP